MLLVQCKNRKLDPDGITILVTTAQTYCGGAAPSEEIIDELATPKPLQKDTIYILLEGKALDEAIKLVTDNKGLIQTNLPEGHHSAFLSNPANFLKMQNRLSEKEMCELQWKQQMFSDLVVFEGIKAAELFFLITCNPCEEPRP